MNNFILPGKAPSENLLCNIPFSDVLVATVNPTSDEIIIALVVTISVFSGTDPAPASVLLGPPTTDLTNTFAIFTLTGGVAGVIYVVSVLATGSIGTIALKTGYLSVIPNNPF